VVAVEAHLTNAVSIAHETSNLLMVKSLKTGLLFLAGQPATAEQMEMAAQLVEATKVVLALVSMETATTVVHIVVPPLEELAMSMVETAVAAIAAMAQTTAAATAAAAVANLADPAAVVVILVAALLQTGILGLPTVVEAVATTSVPTKKIWLAYKKEMVR
jgi:hypothetical protein